MRVGTSRLIDLEKIADEDHFHACGDKYLNYILLLRIIGSSPCVWGQDNNTCIISAICRIIPMRVGTSPAVQIKRDNNTDHPHACGDKALHTSHCPHSLGSSPCVWGQAGLRCQKRQTYGIIPMRVGTRSNTGNYNIPNKDHPVSADD